MDNKYRIGRENKENEKQYWNGGYWSANTRELQFDDMKTAKQVFNRLFLHATVKGELDKWWLFIEQDCDDKGNVT